MIQQEKIEYLDITKRPKSPEKTIEKIQRKDYDNPPEQLTDLAGIRVITYLETQVRQISKVVHELFEVDEKNSSDKTADLGSDKIGYRSTHFVCTLGNKRNLLPEYNLLCDLKFEIQIRTVLQHAWADLAHDRSFKFGAALPTELQRKLNLYSGMLELVDIGFDEISIEVDEYKKTLDKKTADQISKVEINSLSVKKFIEGAIKKHSLRITNIEKIEREITDELKRYGIRNVGELEKLLTAEFIKAHKDLKVTAKGFIRHLMMYENPQKYFGIKPGWNSMIRQTYDFLSKKHGAKQLKQWLDEAGLLLAKD